MSDSVQSSPGGPAGAGRVALRAGARVGGGWARGRAPPTPCEGDSSGTRSMVAGDGEVTGGRGAGLGRAGRRGRLIDAWLGGGSTVTDDER